MNQMEDENGNQDFQEIYNNHSSGQQSYFDKIIMELQQIVLDHKFEKTLFDFMKNNWEILEETSNKQRITQVFLQYQKKLINFLTNKISEKIETFTWKGFTQMIQNRKNHIDQQIMDTLQSLENIESFKNFIKDYRNSYQQEQMHRVLTIKSNKISENKKIKGKNNIFSQQNNGLFLDDKIKSKKKIAQKKAEQLLVPQLILTVKGMRKC